MRRVILSLLGGFYQIGQHFVTEFQFIHSFGFIMALQPFKNNLEFLVFEPVGSCRFPVKNIFYYIPKRACGKEAKQRFRVKNRGQRISAIL